MNLQSFEGTKYLNNRMKKALQNHGGICDNCEVICTNCQSYLLNFAIQTIIMTSYNFTAWCFHNNHDELYNELIRFLRKRQTVLYWKCIRFNNMNLLKKHFKKRIKNRSITGKRHKLIQRNIQTTSPSPSPAIHEITKCQSYVSTHKARI